jgi:uncharacterized protein YegJ (DUF2314 family)
MENTGKVNRSEIERRIEEYQSTATHIYKRGEYIKTAIKVCNCGCDASEHMWILISNVHNETKQIVGSLANDPTHPSNFVKFGSIHVISFDKIQEHLRII